ncbi:MAG TPA: lipase maturation factor family protein [Candidatus Binatia bacterium]|nr:lipase maturation factor family protein [Candidatus Binatia bacterium]
MKSDLQVASPPAKPLMFYDGDCNFCALWIHRWQQATGERVDYIPFQDARLAEHFPNAPRDVFENAVHLVESNGAVYSGAEAAFRALAHNPRERWLLDWYEHSAGFARSSEWCYRQVARHRPFFSFLTRLGWGRQVEQPTHTRVRLVFLRSLGAIYLIAFVSLWVQVAGLMGSDGILPARLTMDAVQEQTASAHLGWERYHFFPTLCWFSSTDGFLQWQCGAGVALAVLLIAGVAPAPCLFLLWLLYLSLVTVGRDFLSFQWDMLLLETGFLAIFFAPLQLWLGSSRAPPPSRLVLWLLRWLLLRLMFASGSVKLLSGDPAWRNLSALNYHYETQPLPTWVGWYAHQLPASFQKVSTGLMFGIELVLPFLILGPRRVRQVPFFGFVFLQLLILLTGNYCFFNLLSLALCVTLLDDAALVRAAGLVGLNRLTGLKGLKRLKKLPGAGRLGTDESADHEDQSSQKAPTFPSVNFSNPFNSINPSKLRWPLVVTVPLAGVLILIPLMQFCGMFRVPIPWPRPIVGVYQWLLPFRSLNGYGLFAVMTTTRPEIIVEGSNDGVTWLAYEFKYKPGDVKGRLQFVEPHQPRLDWQMWFAALGNYRENPWFVNFCVRLLQGSPEVLGLLKRNPFPASPPRYIRAVLYEYHFTSFAERRRTGAWWRREPKGEYLPVMSLGQK